MKPQIFIPHQQSSSHKKAMVFRINLVRLLMLLVWPKEVVKLTDGRERKIIGKNFEIVNFLYREACSLQKNP